MQGECAICAEWNQELGRCPLCNDYVCLECWALGSRCCIDCKRTRDADARVVSEKVH
jgi:hypothetical protein